MLGVESEIGTYAGSSYGTTDVMQCLDANNPAVYCMAKISPVNGVAYDANEGLLMGMPSSGYAAIRNIFQNSAPQPSLYTTRLSICFGILWLGYKTGCAGGVINTGITNYNGGGNPNYLSDVLDRVTNPGNYYNS